jgi:hypothetical protein
MELKGRSNGIHSVSKYIAFQFIAYLPFERMTPKLLFRVQYTERYACIHSVSTYSVFVLGTVGSKTAL